MPNNIKLTLKNCQRCLPFCLNGKISPNLVTLDVMQDNKILRCRKPIEIPAFVHSSNLNLNNFGILFCASLRLVNFTQCHLISNVLLLPWNKMTRFCNLNTFVIKQSTLITKHIVCQGNLLALITLNLSLLWHTVWPDWAIYWTLGNFLKPLQQLICPNLPHS